MTQVIHMPRSAWLHHFKQAQAAGRKSRAAASKAESRRQSEIRRAAEAAPQLRKKQAP